MLYKIQKIDIEHIFIDHLPINPISMEYATRLKNGEVPPPIRLVKLDETKRYKISDGRHRYVAHLLVGRHKILAKFKPTPLKKEHRTLNGFFQKGLSPRF